jgi:hypothetical protein
MTSNKLSTESKSNSIAGSWLSAIATSSIVNLIVNIYTIANYKVYYFMIMTHLTLSQST